MKMYPVELDNKYGYIDENGKTIVPFIFDYADEFEDEMGFVEVDGL